MKKIIYILTISLFATYINAETNLPSVISSNTSLTKANSPYILGSSTIINAGITLTIEAGAILKLPGSGKITVNGTLLANGTISDTIEFTAINPANDWTIINSSNANMTFRYVKITHAKRFFSATAGDSIIVSHCNIASSARGNGEDCIAAHDTKFVKIDHITLVGAGGKIADGIKNDAIDLDNLDSCLIEYNSVTNFSDDAVDIGTQTKIAIIHDNILSYSNYGITVGENSNAQIYNNISHHNDGGMQTHSKAIVSGYNNTLYANTVGIEAYHSEEGTKLTGGTINLFNTIFYQDVQNEIVTQSNSVININYSISDKFVVPGDNNSVADPLLTDPANGDFSLQPGSPCLNSGKPDSLGNKTSMGSTLGNEQSGFDLITYSTAFQLYPNPASNYITLVIPKHNTVVKVSVFNVMGKTEKEFKIHKLNTRCDIHTLKKGIYILVVVYNNGKKSNLKFIKN